MSRMYFNGYPWNFKERGDGRVNKDGKPTLQPKCWTGPFCPALTRIQIKIRRMHRIHCSTGPIVPLRLPEYLWDAYQREELALRLKYYEKMRNFPNDGSGWSFDEGFYQKCKKELEEMP